MRKKLEKIKDSEKSSWQEDIEQRRYYYDDAFGYEKYEPQESEEENNEKINQQEE
ncbi:MAG: hypothetical protein N2Z23_10375 [Pyrinomonadaceae bacterium]|nr:hypothetical protein [Pyrinomonadaceae bacterium]MCX7640830.1 hypothetical protein [Pyrinomonadaceae bacterium]MDW8303405.1 hypothetical protein [Acidobacteriota bacterium]